MSKTELVKQMVKGKEVTVLRRFVETRKIKRQMLKNAQGNNRIGNIWRARKGA